MEEKRRSLYELYPVLSAEWHPTKNGILTPADVLPGSRRKVWWICSKGHIWEAAVINRTNGSGCPVCAGKKILVGDNDLASQYPGIASEWNSSQNGDLTPQNVTPGSNRKVWWRCAHGHEWQATVFNRVRGSGCPICKKGQKKELSSELVSRNSALMSEWHPTKNVLSPSDITVGSGRKVWWRCAAGHEWQATVANRAHGNGCPVCAGKRVLVGVNDLASQFPYIAAEWNPMKNGGLAPEDVTLGSRKKVWWRCAAGHEWQAPINSRVRGSSCPVCAEGRVFSLAISHPALAAEWHPTKNEDLAPEDVPPGSNRKVWWCCAKGHEWQATVANRTIKKYGCPRCSAQKRTMEKHMVDLDERAWPPRIKGV